jgi:hypothetical protein
MRGPIHAPVPRSKLALGIVRLTEIGFPLLAVLVVSEIPIRPTPPQH